MFLWAQASSSALPFGTIAALFCIWLLISCPLVIVGGFIGHRVKPSDKLHTIPSIARQIPRQPKAILRSLPIAVLGGGLLPFAVIFVELIFVFKSFWQDNSGFYYMYGFFGLVSFVLIVTVMEMSIVTTYFLLNSEDYRWWWRSFYVGTGSAWWIFIYSIYYYYCVSDITGFVSSLIFFGYSIIGCVIYGLVTGSIGFLASYAFVHRIYTAIKAE
jgi:transmembrane 9 superfamily protein 2/4